MLKTIAFCDQCDTQQKKPLDRPMFFIPKRPDSDVLVVEKNIEPVAWKNYKHICSPGCLVKAVSEYASANAVV